MERVRIVASNTLAFAIRDGHPVSPGHTLATPPNNRPEGWIHGFFATTFPFSQT
jgi:hypothetical protein